MSVHIPFNLTPEGSGNSNRIMNYTPLRVKSEKRMLGGKYMVRIVLVVLAIGIFTPSVFYLYRESSARSLTNNVEYMQDIQNLSQNKKLAGQVVNNAPADNQNTNNIFIKLLNFIKSLIESIKF